MAQVTSRLFPTADAGFQFQTIPFRLVVEDITMGQIFLKVFQSATANTDDIQFQKYTALEILRSIKFSLVILFYLLSTDKRYWPVPVAARSKV
jgi:hypothetical protein